MKASDTRSKPVLTVRTVENGNNEGTDLDH